jgi:cytochrome c-type biogenesis protein CcmF
MNMYPSSAQPIATPQVRSTPAGDLYLTLMDFDNKNGAYATIHMIVQPLIPWMWVGGGVIVFGALIGLMPVYRRSQTGEAST